MNVERAALLKAKEETLVSLREDFKGISAARQCERLLEALSRWSINTYEASRFLDVYHCPARVLQLRKRGYKITTHWQTVITEAGEKHRVGLYVLESGGKHE